MEAINAIAQTTEYPLIVVEWLIGGLVVWLIG
jgi:hypothetical protein